VRELVPLLHCLREVAGCILRLYAKRRWKATAGAVFVESSSFVSSFDTADGDGGALNALGCFIFFQIVTIEKSEVNSECPPKYFHADRLRR
jgi:hypothetical protein